MMDSDEDDELCLDEADTFERSVVYQAGKLSDILAEVETKIPSLDFDDYLDDNGGSEAEEIFLHHCVGGKLFGEDCSEQSEKNATSSSDEKAQNIVLECALRENTDFIDSVETGPEFGDTVLSDIPSIPQEKDHGGKHESVNLDFEKLQQINFTAVEEALGNFTTQDSSLYDVSLTTSNDEIQLSSEGLSECYLMGRLSDLSKDQIDVSFSVEKIDSATHNKVFTRQFLDNEKRHPLHNIVSSKAIHSWTQLQSQESEQPETVFIDLRPDRGSDGQKVTPKHSTSIQRILGLAELRSDTSSDDDSEDEMENWREMRNKHKETALKEKEICKESKNQKNKYNKSVLGKVDSRLKTNIVMEKVSEEELLGGISNNVCDEDKKCQVGRQQPCNATPGPSEISKMRIAENKLFRKHEEVKKKDKIAATNFKSANNLSGVVRLQDEGMDQINTVEYHVGEGKSSPSMGDRLTTQQDIDNKPKCRRTPKSYEINQVCDNVLENDEKISTSESCDDGSETREMYRETTFSDVNRLVANAVEMLDEVYITRKNLDKTFDTIVNEQCVPLDEKTSVDEERSDSCSGEELSSPCLYFRNISTQTERNVTVDKKKLTNSITNCPFSMTVALSSRMNTVHKKDASTETVNSILHNNHIQTTNEESKTVKDNVNDPCNAKRQDDHLLITSEKCLSEITVERNTKFERKNSPANCVSGQTNRRTLKERRLMKEKVKEKIETMKPTRSANGKFPVAFNTPIIYDQQSSYEPECRSLLPVSKDQVTLLLVVTLHGSGEVNPKSKSSGTVTGVNYYFAMVAWLLSLGGTYNSDLDVPFSIIGMQQAYQNGKIQLFVGVQPRVEPTQNSNKSSIKNMVKAFNKAITKYLSTRSLRSVYQNMGKVYLNGKILLDENHFNSKMLSTYIVVGQDPNAVQRVFGSENRFFWETVEVADQMLPVDDSSIITNENMIVLVQPNLYHNASCILDLLSRVEDEGCGLAGLRLAYHDTFEGNTATFYVRHEVHGIVHSTESLVRQPTLALAIRGPCAISKIKSIVGSKIPILDDPRNAPSLRSLYCATTSEDKLFYCPSYANQASIFLARWFGGRVSEHDTLGIDEVVDTKLNSTPELDQSPPALLISYTQVPVYLICSPLLPPSFIGHVLHTANVRGYSVHGVRRIHLNRRQVGNIGMSQQQQAIFCAASGNKSHKSPAQSPPGSPAKSNVLSNIELLLVSSRLAGGYPSTVIVLQKENGSYHAKSLIECIYKTLVEWYKEHSENLSELENSTWRLYFCTLPFNETNNKCLRENVHHLPDLSLVKQARTHCFWSHPEVEQVCALYAATSEAFQFVGLLLRILYSENNLVAGNWELLAIKNFPSLSLVQAREVTSLEVGDKLWETNVKRLMSTNVVCTLLRGVNIIERLCQFMALFSKMSSTYSARYPDVDWWLSQTPDVTYRQIAVLFDEDEIVSDETCRETVKYVPRLRKKILQECSDTGSKISSNKKKRFRSRKQVECKYNGTDDSSNSVDSGRMCELSLLQSMLIGPRPITTVALIKPSCLLNTKNLGRIFKSICQEDFKMVALRMSVLKKNEAAVLVDSNEPDANAQLNYLTSGACLLMCLQRENAVKRFLDLLGPEDPAVASKLDPFLLRGCYGVDPIRNAIHGSRSYSESLCELRMLFPCGLCCDQSLDLKGEQIACRAVDETIGKNVERKLTKRLDQYTGLVQSLVSSLVQTNCLILTHHIVYGRCGRQKIAFLAVFECLLSLNFVPVGMKMALMTEQHVDGCLQLLDVPPKRKSKMRNDLLDGPCIVLALQRDNAVTCFNSIIESGTAKHRLFEEYRCHIIQGQAENEAKSLLLYFFDALAPHSVEEISDCV